MLRHYGRALVLLGLATGLAFPAGAAIPAAEERDGWIRYDREQIAASGARSLADFLRQLPLNLQGSPRSASFNAQVGHASIDLLGVGAEHVQVLLDGQALPKSAGPHRGANLEWLPLAAIDRVEILPRAASSRFGGRSSAGVVRLVTRKEVGAHAQLGAHVPQDGGGVQREGSLLFGGKLGSWLAHLGAHAQQLDPLSYADRPDLSGPSRSTFSNNLFVAQPSNRGPFGFRPGNFLNHPVFGSALPGPAGCTAPFFGENGRCFYDFGDVARLENAFERRTVSAALDWSDESGARLRLHALSGSQRAELQFGADFSPVNEPFFLPAGSPNHPAVRFPALGYDASAPLFVRHRALALGPRRLIADHEVRRAGAEWSRSTRSWVVAFSASTTQTRLGFFSPNRLDLDATQAAIASGEYDLYTPQSQQPALLDRLRTRVQNRAQSDLHSATLAIDRILPWRVAGLELLPTVAVGAFRERYSDAALSRSVLSGRAMPSTELADGDRLTYFAQAGLDLPLSPTLDLRTRLRGEQAGNAAWRTSSGLTLAWRAVDAWSASLHLERGYRHAEMAVDAQQPVSALTSVRPTVFCSDVGFCGIGIESPIVRNLALRPERHLAWAADLDWHPTERIQLGLSLQGWRLRDRHRLIDTTAFALCLAGVGPCPDGVNFVPPGTPLPAPELGLAGWRVDEVIGVVFNNSMQRTVINQGGVDRRTAALRGAWRVGELRGGQVTLSGEWVRLLSEKLIDAQAFDYADTYPRQRASLSARWERGAHALIWQSRFTDRTLTFNGQEIRRGFGDRDLPATLASHTQHDLQWRWQLAARSTLRLGVLNLTDRKPPIDPLSGSYDPLQADGYLRTAYLRWEQSF